MYKQEYTIMVTMERNAQVLDRILHIFSRRGIGLENIQLIPSAAERGLQQLRLVFREEEVTIKKIINQIDKQIGVMETRVQ